MLLMERATCHVLILVYRDGAFSSSSSRFLYATMGSNLAKFARKSSAEVDEEMIRLENVMLWGQTQPDQEEAEALVNHVSIDENPPPGAGSASLSNSVSTVLSPGDPSARSSLQTFGKKVRHYCAKNHVNYIIMGLIIFGALFGKFYKYDTEDNSK
ncbi:hypothetical protein BKA64DRAFT_132007 [Cadophora sp. MPI-SDFR-AT-0126]|nr:hypothetical protein BKA64DRAFT_132007 [Leotiomycetes sp. MPI-SDFR-AT-0126]